MNFFIRICALTLLAAGIASPGQTILAAETSPVDASPDEVPKAAGIYYWQDGKCSAVPRVPVATEELPASDTAFELSLSQTEPVVCGHLHFKQDAAMPVLDGQPVKLFMRSGGSLPAPATGPGAIKVWRLPRSQDGNFELDQYVYPEKREKKVPLRRVACQVESESPDLLMVTLSDLKDGNYAVFDRTQAAFAFSVHGPTNAPGTTAAEEDAPEAEDVPALPGGYLWSGDQWVRLPYGKLNLSRPKGTTDIVVNGQVVSFLVDVDYTCERDIPKVSGNHLWLAVQGAWKPVTDAVVLDDAHLQLIQLTHRNALHWGVGKRYLVPQKKVDLDFPNLFGLGSHKSTMLIQEVEPELHTVEVLTKLKPGFYAVWTGGHHYLFQATR